MDLKVDNLLKKSPLSHGLQSGASDAAKQCCFFSTALVYDGMGRFFARNSSLCPPVPGAGGLLINYKYIYKKTNK